MLRLFDLRQKEVINTKDGTRFGFVNDVLIDMEEGKIVEFIVPGPGKVFGFFGKDQEYQLPWDSIKQVGEDIILIDVETEKILKNINNI